MANNILVVYKSKYGSTKKYAEWISQELEADLVEAKTATPGMLKKYDIVIYGGGLYAGGISGVKLVTKNPCQNLIIFTVGLGDPKTSDYSEILKLNFTPEFQENLKLFHLRGDIDYSKLSLLHKMMMAVMRRSIARKPEEERDMDDTLFLETYGSKINFASKEYIQELVSYVRESMAIE
ncbi:MAG: flavodoxin domain-containing protein [Eubacteriaceae bacterium]|nr:flavodoxin domain-containing protein [Eubacteriaceae bacterium]